MTLDPTTASSLTEDQAIGVARFAVEKRAPGWQAFEVLLRMHEERMAWECDWCRETRHQLETGVQRVLDSANGGK